MPGRASVGGKATEELMTFQKSSRHFTQAPARASPKTNASHVKKYSMTVEAGSGSDDIGEENESEKVNSSVVASGVKSYVNQAKNRRTRDERKVKQTNIGNGPNADIYEGGARDHHEYH